MKKFFSIIIAILLAAAAFAQSVPQTVNFSATVRDANNQLLANTPITVRLTVYEGGEGGTPVYCAMHQTTTNANGFMSFQLNRNVYAYCSDFTNTPFDEISWANGNYWLYVEYQAQIGAPFESLGYLEITSSFYAFAADRALVAQRLEGFDIDVTNAQDGDILVYNGTTHKWEARRPENIGGGTTPNMPSVTTGTASSVTDRVATLSGNVTSDGGTTVTARGFLYGTNSSNLSQTVQSGSGTGSFTKTLTGLTSGTTYYYKAYATNSAGTAYGEVMSFTTENSCATSGTLNGHDWVDLGLPSGMRWATCNVGATTPEGYGDSFAWGETTTKETYSWDTYRYYDGSNFTKYTTSSDNLTTLEASDDAATANWGSGWRMPTQTEMQELIDNCTVTWTTQNGVNGRLFTGPNGNSIFLPAAGGRFDSSLYNGGSTGYYWSSSLDLDNPYKAWHLKFGSGNCDLEIYTRYSGRSVRPVCVSQN